MLPFTHSFGCESTVGKLFLLFNTKHKIHSYFNIRACWKYKLFLKKKKKTCFFINFKDRQHFVPFILKVKSFRIIKDFFFRWIL